MYASVATADTNAAKPKPYRSRGGRDRGSGHRGPTPRRPQNDPAPADSTVAADTSATPTTAAPTVANSSTVADNTDATSQDDDTVTCLICTEPMTMKYYSISECNHKTCHVCALRLRALWKRQDCSFCKVRIFCRVQKLTWFDKCFSFFLDRNPNIP